MRQSKFCDCTKLLKMRDISSLVYCLPKTGFSPVAAGTVFRPYNAMRSFEGLCKTAGVRICSAFFLKNHPLRQQWRKRGAKKPRTRRGKLMAHPERLELPTRELEARCSIRLSYGCNSLQILRACAYLGKCKMAHLVHFRLLGLCPVLPPIRHRCNNSTQRHTFLGERVFDFWRDCWVLYSP